MYFTVVLFNSFELVLFVFYNIAEGKKYKHKVLSIFSRQTMRYRKTFKKNVCIEHFDGIWDCQTDSCTHMEEIVKFTKNCPEKQVSDVKGIWINANQYADEAVCK